MLASHVLKLFCFCFHTQYSHFLKPFIQGTVRLTEHFIPFNGTVRHKTFLNCNFSMQNLSQTGRPIWSMLLGRKAISSARDEGRAVGLALLILRTHKGCQSEGFFFFLLSQQPQSNAATFPQAAPEGQRYLRGRAAGNRAWGIPLKLGGPP